MWICRSALVLFHSLELCSSDGQQCKKMSKNKKKDNITFSEYMAPKLVEALFGRTVYIRRITGTLWLTFYHRLTLN